MEPDRFDSVYADHLEAIQRYCIRRLPAADVADVVSEVFVVAWRRMADAPEDHLLAWLYAIARNVVRNAHRSRTRRGRLDSRVGALRPEPPDGPETMVVRRHEERTVLDALEALRPGDREVLRLQAWERLTSAEIARVLGTTPHAVDARLSRARQRLTREYERRDRLHEPMTGGRR